MSAPACFIDAETTGLDPDRHEIWEVALVVPTDGLVVNGGAIEPKGYDEYVWQLPVDLGRADPIALNIGRFHERRWRQGTENHRPWGSGWEVKAPYVLHRSLLPEWCAEFVRLTRGLHLVGAVVSFDAERLWRLLRANGECPMWHYHVIDVEALAVGWLAGVARSDDGWEREGVDRRTRAALPDDLIPPPWESEDLSRAIGVDPDDFDRHTALGDARWAKAMYEAVMGT